MPDIKTHVCMVSAQAAPNLLPLLDDELKPQQVILLATPQMQEKAQFLRDVIRPRGISVEIKSLDITDDFESMQEKLMDIIGEIDSQDISLNVTGGNKWMAIAAQEIFRMNGNPVFYVNIDTDQVLYLDKKLPAHKLTQRINLDSYLKAYGYRVINNEIPSGLTPQQRDFCQQLVGKCGEWENAIGQINAIASQGEHIGMLSVRIDDVLQNEDKHFGALVAEGKAAGLLDQDGQRIIFPNDIARAFINGGWLESYVNSILNELKRDAAIQDSPRVNLKVENVKGTKNELDVAFMAKNKLHIIECKTKRMQKEEDIAMGAGSLYKLDSISEMGGFGTKSMLVSYRKLRPVDRQRAEDLRIKIVQAAGIQTLKSTLREWIEN